LSFSAQFFILISKFYLCEQLFSMHGVKEHRNCTPQDKPVTQNGQQQRHGNRQQQTSHGVVAGCGLWKCGVGLIVVQPHHLVRHLFQVRGNILPETV
jgi:hypothetical protein